MSNLFDVSDEVVVLTGVSGQLGIQYARSLLSLGACVAGIDKNNSKSALELKSDYPDTYLFSECDILSKESLEKTRELVIEKFGVPSVLINNAAIDSPPDASQEENGPFENYSLVSWEKVLSTNVTGTFIPCQVFGETMAANKRGSIINISSIYGVLSPDQSIYDYRRRNGDTFYKPASYSVSKSAILNLTRYLAVYWAKSNVRVNTLVIAGVERGQDKEFLEAYNARIPIGRMAKEADYNGAVIFLSSNASIYMTGSQLVVDGGWTSI